MEIILKGKTRHGQNRIKEQGERWSCLKEVDNVLFSSASGPWMLLESVVGKHVRWVRKISDVDFDIV